MGPPNELVRAAASKDGSKRALEAIVRDMQYTRAALSDATTRRLTKKNAARIAEAEEKPKPSAKPARKLKPSPKPKLR